MSLLEVPSPVDLGSERTEVVLNPRGGIEASEVAAALERTRPLRAHVWVATSGTTGAGGRFVALSKDAILASARAVNAHLGAGSADAWLHALPTFHVGGLGILARARLAGVPVHEGLDAGPAGRRWDPPLYRKRALESGAALSSLVPAQLHDLVALGLEAPATLRAIVIGGDTLGERLRLAARSLGWNVLPSYGCTECASQAATATPPGDDPRLRPLGHVELRTGDDGRLALRGASLLTGAVAFGAAGEGSWTALPEDGWFVTGDLGEVRDGFVEIRGRASDVVKVGGESVDLARLARILDEEASAMGAAPEIVPLAVPDERLGLAIHAAVAAREGSLGALAAAAVLEKAGTRMLPFERPRRVHFVESIPRTELGKIRRAELLRRILGG